MRELSIVLIAITSFLMLRTLFDIVFKTDNMRIQKKRFKQLEFDKNAKSDMSTDELLDKVTAPIIEKILPRLGAINEHTLEKKLRLAQWNEKITPKQFRALDVLLKIVGIVMGGLMMTQSAIFGLVWFAAPFFGMNFFLNNSSKNRVEKLLLEFPDFIRVTQGYLTTSTTLIDAVEHTIPFVGETWTPILENFVVTSRITNVEDGIAGIIREADTPEIREFLSIINLTLEQGGKARDAFELQAQKIQEMIQDKMMMKIGKRKTLGTFLQAPLLLCNMAVMGLPTIGAFMESGF